MPDGRLWHFWRFIWPRMRNSNAGHDYQGEFSDAKRRQLIEYMKSLYACSPRERSTTVLSPRAKIEALQRVTIAHVEQAVGKGGERPRL